MQQKKNILKDIFKVSLNAQKFIRSRNLEEETPAVVASETDKTENGTSETTDNSKSDNAANETNTENKENEIKEDEKNEPAQNKTAQFKESRLNMSEKSDIMGAKCIKYEILSNYSSFKIELDDLKNVTDIIVSEKNLSFSECKQESFQTCNQSSYCKRYNNNKKDELEFDVLNCFKTNFIYLFINETTLTNQSYGEIKIKSKDKICGNGIINEWEYCSSLSLKKCGSENSQVCDSRCKLTTCFANSTYNSSSCIPVSVPFSTKENQLCLGNEDDFSKTSKSNFKYCGYGVNVEAANQKKPFSFGFIIVIILFIILFIFLLSICWYRMKLGSDKVAPFTPPNCCPEWIYPKPEVNERLVEQEYRPPYN